MESSETYKINQSNTSKLIRSQELEKEAINDIPKDFSEEELRINKEALGKFQFVSKEARYIVRNNPHLAFLLVNNPEITQNIADNWGGSQEICRVLSAWIEWELIKKSDLAIALTVMNKIKVEDLPSIAIEIAAEKGLLHNIKELFQTESDEEELNKSLIKEIKKEYTKFCREREFNPESMEKLLKFVEHIHEIKPEAIFLTLRSTANLSYIIKEAYKEGYQEKASKIFFIDVSNFKMETDISYPLFQEEIRKTVEKLKHLSKQPSIVVADEVMADCRTTRKAENVINIAATRLNKTVAVHKLSPNLEKELYDKPTLFTRVWNNKNYTKLQGKIGQIDIGSKPAHRISAKNFKDNFSKENYMSSFAYAYAEHGFPETLSEYRSFLRERYGAIGKTIGRRIKEKQKKTSN